MCTCISKYGNELLGEGSLEKQRAKEEAGMVDFLKGAKCDPSFRDCFFFSVGFQIQARRQEETNVLTWAVPSRALSKGL